MKHHLTETHEYNFEIHKVLSSQRNSLRWLHFSLRYIWVPPCGGGVKLISMTDERYPFPEKIDQKSSIQYT